MIHKGTGRLKTWFRVKLAAAARVFTPASKVVSYAKSVLVAADGNVLDMGKRYRLTSGHAPLFSLYTFFNHRQ